MANDAEATRKRRASPLALSGSAKGQPASTKPSHLPRVYGVQEQVPPSRAGQGASLIERLFTGISGSQTGGQSVKDISLSELVSGSSFGSWPLNLPGAGSQTETTINVPYRFMGITEQLSWLAQFSGQGYEDISALASLIMLQEMMLG